MHVEPFELFGRTGQDFVTYAEDGLERFAARLFDGGSTLQIRWTDHVPRTLLRLKDVQQVAGGRAAFDTLTGQASFELREMIIAGEFNSDRAARLLCRALGGRWQVDVVPRPKSLPPAFDIVATKLRDAL